MTSEEFYMHAQNVAFKLLAWRGPSPELAELIARSLRHHGITPDESKINALLRKHSVQTVLRQYQVATWRAPDGSHRLVSLHHTHDPQAAARRIANKPANSTSCSYCLIDEKDQAQFALRPEVDRFRRMVPEGRYLHPQCEHAWRELRELASRVDEPKESVS